jgi:hypothetical protein
VALVGAVVVAGIAGAARFVGLDGGGARPTPYLHQTAIITFPAPYSNPASFDIGWVDPNTQAYYLADKTNHGVDAIDGSNDTFGSVIGQGKFAPSVTTLPQCRSTGGPNGVLSLTVGGVNQLWAADGVTATTPSNVKVFTLTTPTSGTLAATISTAVAANQTAGNCRADEMAYSPEHRLFLVANDLDTPVPYVSLISVNPDPTADAVVGQIKFPNAVGGIEQPVWDQQQDRFYINIPGVEVAVINPNTLSVSATYPTPGCSASGLALDPKSQQLLLSCGVNPNGVEFMDARTGQITANFPQVSGADEVWFDPGSRNFYLAASGMTSSGQPVPTVTTTGSGTAWTLRETNATGGTFTLTVGTTATSPLPFNASATAVQTALAAIVPGTTVSGGPLPGTLAITFGAAQTIFTGNGADLTPPGYSTPVLGAISAGHGSDFGGQLQWLANVPTTAGDHSVAANPINGQVYVPLQPGLGIGVFVWSTPPTNGGNGGDNQGNDNQGNDNQGNGND